jgi:osmoprotectant transport system substrate-binding protein
MYPRRILAGLAAASAAIILTSCGGDSDSSSTDTETEGGAAGGTVRLSGQNFPEATLVAEMYTQILENNGYDVEVKLVDTRDVYMADFPGGVDLVPEYVGGIVDFLNAQANGADAEAITTSDAEATIEAAKPLLEEQGLTLLGAAMATDHNAFFVTQEYSEAEGVTTLSDLRGKSVVLAAAPDCEGRTDCAGGLTDVYGIKITEILPLGYASNDTYQSVINGESQLGETSTTDGTLESQGLVLLEDDQNIQPAQNLVPAISTEFLAAHPDIEEILAPLMSALTTEDLTRLNGLVSVDREKPADVANSYLEEEDLLD